MFRNRLRAASISFPRTLPLGYRSFHAARSLFAVKPFVLADIGEGIKECEVIQWFVEPGAEVEQFDLICEVQSDKASVEITSRYNGIIKALHYEPGQMAIVGKPLVDIDILDEETSNSNKSEPAVAKKPEATPAPSARREAEAPPAKNLEHFKTFATPAVRRICRENNVDVHEITGTGKDGRVMKEDVLRYLESGGVSSTSSKYSEVASATKTAETISPLSPIQKQMFNTMSRSLTIPHFLYADEIELDNIAKLRKSINEELANQGLKLSFMPFFIKALSLSLNRYPILNSRVLINEKGAPSIVNRPQHNIGVAMDTPLGLIVPNIKNVQNLSILEIGEQLARLQLAGKNGKLATSDLQGGTITLSNIGTVGGTYVGPVIVDSEVAIGGVGKATVVPRFDANMNVVPKTIMNASWSGDHRVLDGVTMAKMVDLWKTYIEKPEKMMIHLK